VWCSCAIVFWVICLGKKKNLDLGKGHLFIEHIYNSQRSSIVGFAQYCHLLTIIHDEISLSISFISLLKGERIFQHSQHPPYFLMLSEAWSWYGQLSFGLLIVNCHASCSTASLPSPSFTQTRSSGQIAWLDIFYWWRLLCRAVAQPWTVPIMVCLASLRLPNSCEWLKFHHWPFSKSWKRYIFQLPHVSVGQTSHIYVSSWSNSWHSSGLSLLHWVI
jgi:hypothetical protein